jgi:hypothetical protein
MPTTPAPRPAPRPRRQLVRPNDHQPTPLPFPINRYRVLFSDGALVDFLSYADHSGIRGEMLEAHFGKLPAKGPKAQEARIEGIAHLGQEYVYTPASP